METGTVICYDYNKPIKERHSGPCGPYYFTRRPPRRKGEKFEGFSGYLSKDGTEVNEGSFVRLRVKKASDIISLRHSGWYCDPFQDQTIYGVVAILPRSRGYLAGWSMGEGMITSFAGYIYDDMESAAHAADQEAQSAAEREREYRDDESQEESL
jgi:hypothetical protein